MKFDMKEYFNLYMETKTEDEKEMIEKMAVYDLFTMINNPEDYEVTIMADPEKKAKQLINDLTRVAKCPVYFMNDPYRRSCMGSYYIGYKFIRVSDNLYIEDKAKVIAHELAHSLETEDQHNNINLSEIKADTTALLVCNFYRIDSYYNSINYINDYIKDFKKECFINGKSNDLEEMMIAIQGAFIMAVNIIEQINNGVQNGYSLKKYKVNVEKCEKAYINATTKLINCLDPNINTIDEILEITNLTIEAIETHKDSMDYIEIVENEIKLFEREQRMRTRKK